MHSMQTWWFSSDLLCHNKAEKCAKKAQPQKLRLLAFLSWKRLNQMIRMITDWWFFFQQPWSWLPFVLSLFKGDRIQAQYSFSRKGPLCGTYLWGGEGHKAKLRRLLGMKFDSSPNHKANRGHSVRKITISLPYFSHDDLLWQWLEYY